ncbi:MAG: 4-alpha-glucanotransferase [Atopobiaceae bacterium]
MKRASGIILPISSLPSPHGIGTLGEAAYEFVDFLADAKQSWWQILPVGPTSYGDSPYQSPSAFAGNPYFVDLDLLVSDGLLEKDEVEGLPWGADPARVDYGLLYENRPKLLRKAAKRGLVRDAAQVKAFRKANSTWLEDYALFMSIKAHFGMVAWNEWPDEDARLRKPEALKRYASELKDDIDYYIYVQYLFFKQWEALRTYAHAKGVKILGDMPIYVAMDSADVWANPKCFQLDEKNVPYEVAGVPPDYFSADGQLWGNPLYDYKAMEKDGFAWWIQRVAGAGRLYDALRIDHFRGFESYWAVPFGEKTARNGHWVKGPGMKLVGRLKDAFPEITFIAEDLGYPTPEVRQLLLDSGFPGMKVLEFAFDSRDGGSDYMPHCHKWNCVCYTGTHDNSPLMGWKHEAAPEDVAMACEYLGIKSDDDFVWGFIRGGMSSVANLFVAQMQDYLELGSESRMNIPGVLGGNWQWRLLPGQASPELIQRLAAMTHLYGRDGK